MADIFTGNTTGFVNNYPEQTTASLSDIRLEQMKQASDVLDAIRDARFNVITETAKQTNDLSRQVDAIDDTVSVAIAQVSRDTMDLRSQVTGLGFQVRDGFTAAAKDAEINALKTQIELAKQSTYLSDKIDGQAERTRELISKLNDDSLNRQLVERNTELVGALEGGRYWWGRYGDGQFQNLNSQLQAFQSQLQETRQGMVNFGTMAGVGQSSTSNNVR